MKNRILGIDVARALAIVGMIVVNFKIVLGNEGNEWLELFAGVFDGKAAATFVFLAGVGVALMTQKAWLQRDQALMRKSRTRLYKRALFLFVVGLLYYPVWPADILHFYGIYLVVATLFITRPSRQILIGATVVMLLFPFLMIFFNYEADWNLDTLSYPSFWTPTGFIKNLFFNGFHPVIPWSSFILTGLWFGRQNLRDERFLKQTFRISLGAFILIQAVSGVLVSLLSSIEGVKDLLGTHPMPPMPLYILNGVSIALAVTSGCIYLGHLWPKNMMLEALNKMGQLALTFYVAHVIIGMGGVELFGSKPLGEYSLGFSLLYALAFSAACLLFAVIWLRFRRMGPLEWLMRKITS